MHILLLAKVISTLRKIPTEVIASRIFYNVIFGRACIRGFW